MPPQKPKEPRFYSSEELDRMDKEMSRQVHAVDKMLVNSDLDRIQEYGIDSSNSGAPGHVSNIFFNHKVIQSPRHTERRTVWAMIFLTLFVLFILWALGVFLLPGLSIP